jgi:hypothetical protein
MKSTSCGTPAMAKSLLIQSGMDRNTRKKTHTAVYLLLIIVSVTGVFSSNGYPSEWCFVASSKDFYYYVDSGSISSSGKNVTFWIVQQEIETGKVIYKKQFTINCEDETVVMREVERFGFAGALRNLFSDGRSDEWDNIRPHSKMHAVQNILCCDSKPRQHVAEYLQRTTVRKEELKIVSDVLPDKH